MKELDLNTKDIDKEKELNTLDQEKQNSKSFDFLAHDINNVFNNVRSSTELCRIFLEDSSQLNKVYEQLIQQFLKVLLKKAIIVPFKYILF